MKIFKGVHSPDTLSPHPRAAPLSLGRFYSLCLIRAFLTATRVHCLMPFRCPPLRRVWINGFSNLPSSSRRLYLDSPLSLFLSWIKNSIFLSLSWCATSALTTSVPFHCMLMYQPKKKNLVKLILRYNVLRFCPQTSDVPAHGLLLTSITPCWSL